MGMLVFAASLVLGVHAPGDCVCLGEALGLHARHTYGVHCSAWDAPDEEPWCLVMKGACGKDTFLGEKGRYWSHVPCSGGGSGERVAKARPVVTNLKKKHLPLRRLQRRTITVDGRMAPAALHRALAAADRCHNVHTIKIVAHEVAASGPKNYTALLQSIGDTLDSFLTPRFEWHVASEPVAGLGPQDASPTRPFVLSRRYPTQSAERLYRRGLQQLFSPARSTVPQRAGDCEQLGGEKAQPDEKRHDIEHAAHSDLNQSTSDVCSVFNTVIVSHPRRFFGSLIWSELAHIVLESYLLKGATRVRPAMYLSGATRAERHWFAVSREFCAESTEGGPIDRWLCYFLPLGSCPVPRTHESAALRARQCTSLQPALEPWQLNQCKQGHGNFVYAAGGEMIDKKLLQWSNSFQQPTVAANAAAMALVQRALDQSTTAMAKELSGWLPRDVQFWRGAVHAQLITRPRYAARSALARRKHDFIHSLGNGRAERFAAAVRTGACVAVHLRRGDKLGAAIGVHDPREVQLPSFLSMQRHWLEEARQLLRLWNGEANTIFLATDDPTYVQNVVSTGKLGPVADLNIVSLQGHNQTQEADSGIFAQEIAGIEPAWRATQDELDLWLSLDLASRCRAGLVANLHSTFSQLFYARACLATNFRQQVQNGARCPPLIDFATRYRRWEARQEHG